MLDNYSNFISQNKSVKASEKRQLRQSKDEESHKGLYFKDIVEQYKHLYEEEKLKNQNLE